MDNELLKSIFINNFATWIILISLLFILIGNPFRDKYTNRLFYFFLLSIALLDGADIIDYYFFHQDYLSPWRYFGSISGYILRSLILLILILILLRREKNRKTAWLLWVPLMIEIIFVVTTPWTHIVYHFDETNHFNRDVLGYLPHLISGIYILVLLILTFVFSLRFDKTEVMTVCLITLFAVAATIFESVFSYKFLTTAALAISCLVYYLYFYVRQSHIDELTGVFNRQSFFSDFEKVKHSKVYFVMVDFNGLKQINDKKGHSCGDEALIILANSLRKAANNKITRVYRVGGDEFIVMLYNSQQKDVKEYITRAYKELEKTPYRAAVGYSEYNDGDLLDDCLRSSDVEMYKEKDKYYKNSDKI